jgi:hypothetical protein
MLMRGKRMTTVLRMELRRIKTHKINVRITLKMTQKDKKLIEKLSEFCA